MDEFIEYSNIFGKVISEEQAFNLGKYVKTYYVNNVAIKKERYESNELKNLSYLVTSQNEINNILQESPTVSFNYSYQQGQYTIIELLSYSEGTLVSKRMSINNSEEKTLCYQVFDIATDSVIPSRTKKFYYDSSGEKRYSFEYNEDGSCFRIYDEQNDQSDIHAAQIGDTTFTDFTWVGFEYYQFAEPSVPNN